MKALKLKKVMRGLKREMIVQTKNDDGARKNDNDDKNDDDDA